MNYQNLYLLAFLICIAIIAWSIKKIRKLTIENTRLKIELSCLSNDIEVLRYELQVPKSNF